MLSASSWLLFWKQLSSGSLSLQCTLQCVSCSHRSKLAGRSVLLVWNAGFSIICCVAVLCGVTFNVHFGLCCTAAHRAWVLALSPPMFNLSVLVFYFTDTCRRGLLSGGNLPLMVQDTCRTEGTLLQGKDRLRDGLKSREVKWRKQMSEFGRTQVTPFSSVLLHMASFQSSQ